ncbi:FMN-binding protein [Streptacidiphilus monticola]|uniref:FMN-binding protein n=1 Tax=Streptacidiphilus monticola TaxID=2161674 RepID=A0ABW1G4U8_9ACTN
MRRAVVTTAATAAGIVMLLSMKPHGTELGGSTALGSTGSGTGTAAGSGSGAASTPSAGASSGTSAGTSAGTGSGSASGSGKTSAPGTGSGSSSSSSATRTVTGDSVDTRWGPVQVQLTMQGKKITKVDVVQYPQNNRKDEEINSYALPVLTQETLSAQNADIQAVSGATVTSDGYIQSLQSALDKS